MKILSLFFGLIFSAQLIYGQYQVNIQYDHPKDTILYFRLATFDDKLFIPKDTVKLVKNKASIHSKTSVYGGFYYLYLPASGYKIQLCLENNDNVTLQLNGQLPFDSIKTNDPENKIFLKYQSIERSFLYLDSQYNELQKRGAGTLKVKEAMYKPKRDSLMAFRKKEMSKLNQKGLLYKYFSLLNKIDSYAPDKTKYAERKAFIDQFNFKDPQLYFSPLLKAALYEYLSAYPLLADSSLIGMDYVMKKMDCKDKPYANTYNYFASVLQSNTMRNNMKGFVLFTDKYLIKNSCNFLTKSKKEEFLATFNQYKDLANTDTIFNIVLKDTSGVEQNLAKQIVNYDFTVISFFDPTCEHCKIQVPEMDSTIKQLRERTGFKILNFAVCNTAKVLEKEWKKFIVEKNLSQDYIHVLLGEQADIRNEYAAYSNPMFFLCDKNGTLLLKKANISTIKNYILKEKRP